MGAYCGIEKNDIFYFPLNFVLRNLEVLGSNF